MVNQNVTHLYLSYNIDKENRQMILEKLFVSNGSFVECPQPWDGSHSVVQEKPVDASASFHVCDHLSFYSFK